MRPPKEYLCNISLLALAAANVIPLFGAFLWGWDAFNIIFLFWAENFVVGFYIILKMAFAKVPRRAALIKVLPFAFVLIGLFEVWVNRETVERHLGEESGARGYLWALVLSGITVGGVFVAFPVAYSLHKKGAALGVIFTYIGASAVCRIPMNLFELSFMGLKFTAIRLVVSLPLVVLSSVLLGQYLKKQNYAPGFPK